MIRYNSYIQGYTWLSNFHLCPLVVPIGLLEWDFHSVEAAYQCLKQVELNEGTIRPFTKMSAQQARKYGKLVELRPDWEQSKLKVMTQLCRAKFVQNPLLGTALLSTQGHDLVHLSPWDRFWGVDNAGHGLNEHGVILMQIREELWYADHCRESAGHSRHSA